MGADEETARGIRDGSYYAQMAAQETVNAVHNTVDGADGGTIKIRTTEQQSVIDAVRRVINSITTLLSRFKITLPIQFASTAGSVLSRILPGYSQGGIVTRAQVATVAEGNDAEAIIPLATSQRSRALELYSEVGDILGAQSGAYNLNKGGGGDDLANRIAAKIAAVLQQTPITNTVNLEMVDGDVLIDGEKAGRKLAPVVSRVQAQRR
jgi:SLT domain-containing protein